MLSRSVRILNFDDSVVKQSALISRYNCEIINLKEIGPSARFWADTGTAGAVRRCVAGSSGNAVTFLGSGDFHHITSILLEGFDEPLCLIDFDMHPDWTIIGPRLGCGAWLAQAMHRKQNILKCIILGVSSGDLSPISLQYGDFSLFKDNRLELYPYSHHPSRVFLRPIPDNMSMKVRRGVFYKTIYWNELNSKNPIEFFLHIIRRLPSKKAYISIDKDCLKKDYAMTNWNEGMMGLDELLLMLKTAKENIEIAGVDITGDYSQEVLNGSLKKMISNFNRPKDCSSKGVAESVITAVNEETNLKILETLMA